MLHCTYIQVHQPDYWSSLKSLFRFSPLFPRKNTEPSQEYIFSSTALQDNFYLLLPKLQTKWKLPNSFFKLVKTGLEGPQFLCQVIILIFWKSLKTSSQMSMMGWIWSKLHTINLQICHLKSRKNLTFPTV